MNRLIYADELINLIPAPIYTSPDGQDLVLMSDVMEAIKRAATIEPERKIGEWKHINDGYIDIYECNQCGKTEDYERNYCPNCGTYMKKRK